MLVKSVDEFHQDYNEDSITELKKCALYIQEHVEKLYDHYEIYISGDESEEITEKLYHTMLIHVSESAEELDKEEAEIISDILEDFEERGKRSTGNILALIGKAGTIEDTRHEKVTQLATKIAEYQSR